MIWSLKNNSKVSISKRSLFQYGTFSCLSHVGFIYSNPCLDALFWQNGAFEEYNRSYVMIVCEKEDDRYKLIKCNKACLCNVYYFILSSEKVLHKWVPSK